MTMQQSRIVITHNNHNIYWLLRLRISGKRNQWRKIAGNYSTTEICKLFSFLKSFSSRTSPKNLIYWLLRLRISDKKNQWSKIAELLSTNGIWQLFSFLKRLISRTSPKNLTHWLLSLRISDNITNEVKWQGIFTMAFTYHSHSWKALCQEPLLRISYADYWN